MSDAESHGRQGGRGPRCEDEDRLVGLLVDGDADGVAGDAFALLDHLAGCSRCAGAVAAARRIDALVAETTVRPDPNSVEAWLAAAVASSPRVVPPSGDPREPRRAGDGAVQGGGARIPEFAVVLCAALLVAAVSLWLVLRAGGDVGFVVGESATRAATAGEPRTTERPVIERPVTESPPSAPPTTEPRHVEPGGADRIATGVDEPRASAPAAEDRDLIVLSTRDPQRRGGRLGEQAWPATTPHVQQATVAALLDLARWPQAEPLEAVSTALLLTCRPSMAAALRGWRQDVAVAAYQRAELAERVRWLAGEAGDGVARWIEAPARDDRPLRARLAQLLRSEPTWTEIAAAGWLGGAEFEAALLQVAARSRGARWHAVVAATRRASELGGRTVLLLELVLQAMARGGDGDPTRTEEVLVQQVFAGLGDRVAHELARALPVLRRADQRRVALRALGELADPATSMVLSAVLLGPRVEEAELAAWALGRITAGADRLTDLRPPRRRIDLWRTALVSRRDPLTAAWIAAIDLTDPERELLLAGDFTPRQCAIVARLLGGLEARPTR